ncbi:MAG: DUF72 domain-containing protein [Deltaproteobacteria bacterium]|nr:DUF72 domain-containing protein [Deltaproteobacteria bacterium]
MFRIGTSGWTYPHWIDRFYPPEHSKSRWLEYYAQHFDTVELNASFYRLPKPVTFENWKARTPAHFLWSVKASKFITHTKRLKDPQEPLTRLYRAAGGLGKKLGVVLFQLPPSLTFDKAVFQDFCQALDPHVRHALEVRHPSWIGERVLGLLEQYNVAFCVADTAGRYPYCEAVTADFVYVRLHGSKKLYASDYSVKELRTWAAKLRAWGKLSFVYFDNDAEGYAIKNARQLRSMLSSRKS